MIKKDLRITITGIESTTYYDFRQLLLSKDAPLFYIGYDYSYS